MDRSGRQVDRSGRQVECPDTSYGAAAGSWLVKVWLYRGGFAAAGVPILGTVFGELFQKSFLVKKRWTGQFSSCFYQNLDAGWQRLASWGLKSSF